MAYGKEDTQWINFDKSKPKIDNWIAVDSTKKQ